MYFNPMIFGAILLQSLVAAASRTAGAIVGFLITTGILVWGLDAYARGFAITFFGIELSLPMFILASLFWYSYDARQLAAARKPKPQTEAAQTQTPQ